MNITIFGGGNIGTQFAVHCAEKQHQVIIYGSKPEFFHKHLYIVDEDRKVTHKGEILKATNDEKEAFSSADIIFVTVPAFCMKNAAEQIYPYVKPGVKIGLIPGTGGGECAFRLCIEKGAIIFGMQRVPGVARLVEYGRCVCATGYRKELCVASLPNKYAEDVKRIVINIFDMPCIAFPNYLNLTLTPSNPILHTTRLKTIFKDYREGMRYDYLPLFYEGWDNETSRLLLRCDDEVQKICRNLKEFDLSHVKPLSIHYESETAEQLTRKISGIQGFKGLKTPSIKVGEQYIPDLNSRYFVADFSFGLAILVQIADLIDLGVPYMLETLKWYRKIALKKQEFQFAEYLIENYGDLKQFYVQ